MFSKFKELSLCMCCLGQRRVSLWRLHHPPLCMPLLPGFRQIPEGGVSQEGKGKRKDLSKSREGTIVVSQDPSSAQKDN